METNHINILLVDTHPAQGGKIKTVLQQSIKPAFRISFCQSREDGLRILEKDLIKIDVVVLDLCLADSINPKEIYRIIKRAAKETPIVVIADKQAHALACEVTSEGAADIVVRERLDAHPQRLHDAIEFSIIRNKRLLQLQEKNQEEIDHQKHILHWLSEGYSHEIEEALDACL